MGFYKDYFQALLDVKSEQEKRFKERKAEVDKVYDTSEARVNGTYQAKLNKLQEDKSKKIKDLEGKFSDLEGCDDSETLTGNLRNLVKERNRLREQYEQIEAAAREKNYKRQDVRSKRFTFWWKTI